MPEQISKYPEVTIKGLKGGARCGDGVDQQILTRCPRERFCALPSGEVCVYGIDEIPQMTQIAAQELAGVVCPPSPMAGISIGPGDSVSGSNVRHGSRSGLVWAQDQFA